MFSLQCGLYCGVFPLPGSEGGQTATGRISVKEDNFSLDGREDAPLYVKWSGKLYLSYTIRIKVCILYHRESTTLPLVNQEVPDDFNIGLKIA